MASFNHVTLIGNMTRDIELRNTGAGAIVGNFGLAINNNWFDKKTNQKKTETTFIDCQAWSRSAEIIDQFAKKGSPLMIAGRLKTESWEDKEGQRRTKLVVVVENVQLLGSRISNDAPAAAPDPAMTEPANSEDVPF